MRLIARGHTYAAVRPWRAETRVRIAPSQADRAVSRREPDVSVDLVRAGGETEHRCRRFGMNKRLTLRLVLVAVALVVRVAFYSSACSSSHDYSSFQAPSFSGHDPSADPGASDLSDLSDEGGHVAELGVGLHGSGGRAGFAIGEVYRNQKPTQSSPWHAPAPKGAWTYFDAELAGDPGSHAAPIPFTVGVRVPAADASRPFSFGDAVIITSSPEAGQRFVERFATAFHAEVPATRARHPLQATTFGMAILGRNMKEGPAGLHEGGGVTGTKWFLQDEHLEAEVFFNFDLDAKVGEFAEKDEDYRHDLLAALAIHLRDGPLPDRTPATDPSLTLDGPRPRALHAVGSEGAEELGWRGPSLVYREPSDKGSVVLAVDPRAGARPVEVARVDHLVDGLACASPKTSSLAACLLTERESTEEGTWSPGDVRHFWWVAKPGAAKVRVTGPWDDGHANAADEPVSPDGRFVAVTTWRPKATRGNDSVVHIVDVSSQKEVTVAPPSASVDVVGWQGSGEGLRAIVHDRVGNDSYLVDPVTGKLGDSVTTPGTDKSVSPDGKRRCELRADGAELAFTGADGSGPERVFHVHPDDVGYTKDGSCTWVSPRYVLIHTDRAALVDADTLKMSYPYGKDDRAAYDPSPDFQWVARSEGGRLQLGRMGSP